MQIFLQLVLNVQSVRSTPSLIHVGTNSNPGSATCTLETDIPLALGLSISIPLVVSVFMCVIVILCCVKSCCNKYKMRKTDDLRQLLLAETSEEQMLPLAFDQSLFQIPFEELVNFEEIGSGGSSALILKAQWKNQLVVVKLIRIDTLCDNMMIDPFVNELKLCSSLRAKNIVFFYGACLKLPRVGIVLEYCAHGTLRKYLLRNTVSWKKKIDLVIEIAQGLTFLHSKGVIHRDMKSDNILIDDDLHAKISDFGISTDMQKQNQTRIGTSQYMAPEVSMGHPYTEKCDIFSLSIIMFEILTQNFYPYGNNAINIEMRVARSADLRPQVPKECECDASHIMYIELMKKCWNHDACLRPTATQIVTELTDNYSLLYQM